MARTAHSSTRMAGIPVINPPDTTSAGGPPVHCSTSPPAVLVALATLTISALGAPMTCHAAEDDEGTTKEWWEQYLTRTSIKMALSATTDESSDTTDDAVVKSESTADTTIEIGRGRFPTQVRAKTSWKLKLEKNKGKENKITDELSSFSFSYDHYSEEFSRWANSSTVYSIRPATCAQRTLHGRWDVEPFVFAERFSDSYLFISNRYEVGFGTKLEWNYKSLTQRGAGRFDKLKQLCSTLTTGGKQPDDKTVMSLSRAEAANHMANSRVQIGLAASMFREFERPDVLPAFYEDAQGKQQSFGRAPEATAVSRFAIRPGLVLRPTDRIEIAAQHYWKIAFGSGSKLESRKRDVRTLLDVSITYKAEKDDSEPGEVSVTLSGQWHHDNGPPNLDKILGQMPAGESPELSMTSAPDEHRTVKLQVSITI